MTPIEITEKELEEQIDRIVEEYDKGSDQHYAIVRDGEKIAYLVPFDGPYEAIVEEDENGDAFIPLPVRLLNKLGIKEGDDLEVTQTDHGVELRKKE
jgi:hypothetical protein